MKIKYLPLLAFAFIFALFLPPMVLGLHHAHDIQHHLSWFLSSSEQFYNGEFYPRWMPSQFNGLGSPAFFFYPPFANFILIFADLLTFKNFEPDHTIAIGAFLMSILSGLSFYAWIKNFATKNIAILASAFYAIAPYHTAIDFFNRAAMAEYAAFIWVPLIFAGIYHVVREMKPRWIIILTGSIAGLFITHLLTALIIAPFAVVYALCLLKTARPLPRRIILLGLTGFAGVGLAAFYFVPALIMLDFINADALHWGTLEENYIYQAILNPSPKDHFLLKVLIAACAYLGIALVVLIKKPVTYIWPVFCVVLFLLMCGVGNFVFRDPSPYQQIQFVWRLMTMMEFAGITAAVYGMQSHIKLIRLACVSALAVLLVFVVGDIANKGRDMLHRDSSILNIEGIKYKVSAPEYFPNGITIRPMKDTIAFAKNYPAFIAKIVQGKGEVLNATQDGSTFIIETKSRGELTVSIHQFYFPGWKATNEAGKQIPVFAGDKDSLASYNVPKGTHKITIERNKTQQEKTGQLISEISLLVLIVLAFYFRKKKTDETAA